jgi:hypothetical protein
VADTLGRAWRLTLPRRAVKCVVFVLFAPDQQVKAPRVLLDSKYPECPARFVVSFHTGMKLGFHAVGKHGLTDEIWNATVNGCEAMEGTAGFFAH